MFHLGVALAVAAATILIGFYLTVLVGFLIFLNSPEWLNHEPDEEGDDD